MKPICKRLTQSLVLTIVLSLAASQLAFAAAPAQDFIPPQLRTQLAADLGLFENSAADYLKNWEALPVRIAELNRQSIVSPRDAASLRALGSQLKNQLTQLKGAADSLVSKLRNANKLNAEFDSFIAAAVTRKRPDAASKLTREGGARALLSAVAQISEQQRLIDQMINDALRNARTSVHHIGDSPSRFAVVPVSLRQPTAAPAALPALRLSFKCIVLGGRLIIKTIKGTDTPADAEQFATAC